MEETNKPKRMIGAIAATLAMAMPYYDHYADIEELRRISEVKVNRFKKSSTYGSGKRIEVRTEQKIGRNEICPKCDSGLKFKKCCIDKE